MFRPVISALLIVASLSAAAVAQDAAPTPQDIFNQRILPIFRSEEPSSCVQCHLASVDLKNYILVLDAQSQTAFESEVDVAAADADEE